MVMKLYLEQAILKLKHALLYLNGTKYNYPAIVLFCQVMASSFNLSNVSHWLHWCKDWVSLIRLVTCVMKKHTRLPAIENRSKWYQSKGEQTLSASSCPFQQSRFPSHLFFWSMLIVCLNCFFFQAKPLQLSKREWYKIFQ